MANTKLRPAQLDTTFYFQGTFAATATQGVRAITQVDANGISLSSNRLTPTTAGWYYVSASQLIQPATSSYVHSRFNGTAKHYGYSSITTAPLDLQSWYVDYFNGSTDYADFYLQNNATSAWGSTHSSCSMFLITV